MTSEIIHGDALHVMRGMPPGPCDAVLSVTEYDIINDPLAQQGGAMQNPTCTWTFDEDDGTHHTSCGDAWQFVDGYAQDNGVRFCPFCGKPVLEKLPIPEDVAFAGTSGQMTSEIIHGDALDAALDAAAAAADANTVREATWPDDGDTL